MYVLHKVRSRDSGGSQVLYSLWESHRESPETKNAEPEKSVLPEKTVAVKPVMNEIGKNWNQQNQ